MRNRKPAKRASVLLMVVGMLAMLFIIISAYVTLSRFDRVSLVQYQRSKSLEQAVDSVNDIIMGMMKQQLANANGDVFGDTPAGNSDTATYEDAPGFRGAKFQAGLEPFFDRRIGPPSPQLGLRDLRYPAMTSTGPRNGSTTANPLPSTGAGMVVGLDAGSPTIEDMVWGWGFGLTSTSGVATPRNLMNQVANENADWSILSRDSVFDADGDGVPDFSFAHNLTLQEIVNAIDGRYTRAPEFYLNRTSGNASAPRIPNATNQVWASEWKRFTQQAKRTASVRAVNNGGMISMYSPSNLKTYNRTYTDAMLRWAGNGADNPVLALSDAEYDSVASQRQAVEPLLRRRGGMLAAWRDYGNGAGELNTTRIPQVLRNLESAFPNTFASWHGRAHVNTGDPGAWQRFDMGVNVDRGDTGFGWFGSATLGAPVPSGNQLKRYNRRKLLTTTSFSDNLSRRQALPDAATQPESSGLDLYQGQLKMYLGDFVNPAVPAQCAYTAAGAYKYGAGGETLVRRVASYYYNMLLGHAFPFFPDEASATNYGESSVSRREMAMMLAVNTIAFAAPRTANPFTGMPGFVDTVAYFDVDSTGAAYQYRDSSAGTPFERTFVGYAPQPFISRVQVEIEVDTDNDGTYDNAIGKDVPNVAIGVELYNPNDATAPDAVNDANALDLSQFAISLDGDPNLGTGVSAPLNTVITTTTAAPGRMPGRWFHIVALRNQNGPNTFFDAVATNNILPVPTVIPTGVVHTVGLWRRASYAIPNIASAGWFLVDEFKIDDDLDSLGTPPVPAPAGGVWGVDVTRDRSAPTYFGGANYYLPQTVGVPRAARWGMVADVQTTVKVPSAGDPDTSQLANPPLFGAAPIGPSVPLPIMNPALGIATAVNGIARPNAFPTEGFLLFVPRFSHRVQNLVGAAIPDPRPMSNSLRREWEIVGGARRGSPGSGYLMPNYPADFGHMPVFDNMQITSGTSSYFNPTTNGQIPWGQLVFDYFTTIDPTPDPSVTPGFDPMRIPGRINVNAAPWYVLAGLPMLGPINAAGALPLLNTASPSFWNPNAGLLVGLDSTGVPNSRRADDVFLTRSGGSTSASSAINNVDGIWRLGYDLAQSIVSYRDQAAYVPTWAQAGQLRLYGGAWNRNRVPVIAGKEPDQYRPDALGYGAIRGEVVALPPVPPNPRQVGFLSLGELLNVKGMDSQYIVPNMPASDPLALGDYIKAVGLMALLDTHFLTTRSNTFTVYATITDRDNPASSIRSQITVDRSNMLPRLLLDATGEPVRFPPLTGPPVVVKGASKPELIGERQLGYFNAAFDD